MKGGKIAAKYNFSQDKPLDTRQALYKTIRRYKIKQYELSKRTKILKQMNQGVYIDPSSLNRYLKGHKDIETEGLDTLNRCLPAPARYYFLSLLSAPDHESPDWEKLGGAMRLAVPNHPDA